jgi:helix-turn-helix protein
VQEVEKLYNRTKEWWDSMHLSFTHYSSLPPKSIKQFSGMTIFSLGAMVSRVIEKGMDESPI